MKLRVDWSCWAQTWQDCTLYTISSNNHNSVVGKISDDVYGLNMLRLLHSSPSSAKFFVDLHVSMTRRPRRSVSRMIELRHEPHNAMRVTVVSIRRHCQAGPILQIDAGKRQIPGDVDHQPPRGTKCSRVCRNCNQSSQCGEVSMSTQIRKVWKKKAPTLARNLQRWNQATSPISAAICSVFWQTPNANATLDGALFNKAQIIDSFSRDMEMRTWQRAAGHSLSVGMEKCLITDFAKKARSHLIKEGNFMAARALDFLVYGAIKNLACLHMDLFPTNVSAYVATREPWPPGSKNCWNVLETA